LFRTVVFEALSLPERGPLRLSSFFSKACFEAFPLIFAFFTGAPFFSLPILIRLLTLLPLCHPFRGFFWLPVGPRVGVLQLFLLSMRHLALFFAGKIFFPDHPLTFSPGPFRQSLGSPGRISIGLPRGPADLSRAVFTPLSAGTPLAVPPCHAKAFSSCFLFSRPADVLLLVRVASLDILRQVMIRYSVGSKVVFSSFFCPVACPARLPPYLPFFACQCRSLALHYEAPAAQDPPRLPRSVAAASRGVGCTSPSLPPFPPLFVFFLPGFPGSSSQSLPCSLSDFSPV